LFGDLTRNQDVILGAVGISKSGTVECRETVKGEGGGDAGALLVLNATVALGSSDADIVPD
jgi:hypothetical protein